MIIVNKIVMFYCMVIEISICFYGFKVKDLLKWCGYIVIDNYLINCVEVDVFKV